jgi:hypothetical protein
VIIANLAQHLASALVLIFRRIRKIGKSKHYLHHVCLPVCPFARYNFFPPELILMILYLSIFWKSVEKIKMSLNSAKGTLHEDLCTFIMSRRYTVAQVMEALHYKLDGLRFNSQWGHWLNSDAGVNSASNRNEQKGSLLAVKVASA